jgi:hypothetical protein
VQHGALFGHVDLVTREHGIDGRRQPARARQLQQQLDGLRGHSLARIIEQQVQLTAREVAEPIRVGSKHVAQMHCTDTGGMCLECLPLGKVDDGHRQLR